MLPAWSSFPTRSLHLDPRVLDTCGHYTLRPRRREAPQNYSQDPTFQLGQVGYLDFCLVKKHCFFGGGQLGGGNRWFHYIRFFDI